MDQKLGIYLLKIGVFILTCLNFSHIQSTPCLMHYTFEMFFPLLRTVLNLSILMPFSASAVFCFTSSTWEKRFPLRIFSPRKLKKVAQGGIRWIERMGHGGHAVFWSKTAQHSAWFGQVCSHHEMGKHTERVLKKFTEKKFTAASHNNAS